VDSGTKPLEVTRGTQFLSLGHGAVMAVRDDEHGYDVELMNKREFWGAYESEEFPGVLTLTVAEKRLKLE
jgi:hypothetical protein